MTNPKNYMNDLKVEVQVPTPGLQNLIKNPDGEQGGWGWESPVANTQVGTGFGTTGLSFATSVSQATYFRSELLPVAAGRYVVARLTVTNYTSNHNVKVSFEWYNSSKVLLSTSTQSAAIQVGTGFVPAALAPANTAYAKMRLDYYNGTINPNANSSIQIKNIMVATSTTSTGFGSIRENLFTDPAGINSSSWVPFDGQPTSISNAASAFAWNGVNAIAVTTNYAAGPWVAVPMSAQDIAVTAGQYYTASAYMRSNGTNRLWRIGLRWRVNGVWSASLNVGTSVANSTTYTRISYTLLAPAGADMARLVFYSGEQIPTGELHYFDGFLVEATNVLKDYFDGATAAGSGVTYAWAGTANASKSTATVASASFDYQPPYAWLPITGSVISVNIDREAMNLGTMAVSIKDDNLDPAGINKTLTPGKLLRLQARDGTNWKNLYVGKVSNANVQYDKEKKVNSVIQGIISLTAVDAMADLANQGESRSVATVSELPYILEGKGVPWNCNGITSHVVTATIPVTNDNASIADQISITRDTQRGHAWVDKDGVLQATTASPWGVYKHVFADVVDTGTTNYMATTDYATIFNSINGGTVAVSSAAARTGATGLRFTSNGGYVSLQSSTIEVPHSGRYAMSWWARSSLAGSKLEQYDHEYKSLTFTAANTWYQQSIIATAYRFNNKWWVDLYFEHYTAAFGNPAAGTTLDFDDFVLTSVPTDAYYTDIDVDWDTDRIINQVELKHIRAGADGQAEEVSAGIYESASSVAAYGPKKSTFTIVGTYTTASYLSYANSILNGNAGPQIRAKSLRMPVKDDASRAKAIAMDLCDGAYVIFDKKVANYYRISSISHSIDASGWYVDVIFDTLNSNAAPQYTPSPTVNDGVGTPAMRCNAYMAQLIGSGAWVTLNAWAYDYSHTDIVFNTGGSFTIQKAGIYDMELGVMFRNEVNSNGIRGAGIAKGGVQIAGVYVPPIAGQGDYANAFVSTKYKLNAGDVITFQAIQTTGGSVNIHTNPYTFCSITKVN